MLSDEKILITGATGMVALPIAASLVAHNEVWGLARFTDDTVRDRLSDIGVTTVAADLVAGLPHVPDDFTYLLHLAYFRGGYDDFDQAMTVNAEGTGTVLRHCRNAKAALVMSSNVVYSPHPDPWHLPTETDPIGGADVPWNPTSGASKVAQEAVARFCATAYGLPVTIARLNAVYGPADQYLPIQHMDAVVAGHEVVTRSDPTPHTPIHTDDLCDQLEALLDAAHAPATIVNWGGDEVVTVQDWCALAGELSGVTPRVRVVELPNTTLGGATDQRKRRSLTGPCRVAFVDGFRREFAARHPDLTTSHDGAGVVRVPGTREPDRWDVDAIVAEARATTGLSDFGPDTFREGLTVLLRCLAETDALTPAGHDKVRSSIVGRLTNRLQIEEWYRAHPWIADQSVDRPVFVTGLPRSGTTALANVMSIDHRFRGMRWWEQEPACPPPVLASEELDPRRVAFRDHLSRMQREQPEQMAMHLYELDSATEDPALLGLELKEQLCTVPVFRYHEWWRECSMRETYAYHLRAVKLLQSQRGPNRWLFKAPHYLFHLDAVLDAYPDACFVITHRDPVKAIPSWASLVTSLYPPGSLERVGPHRVGPHLAAHQVVGLEHAARARRSMRDDQVLDVHQQDFAREPIPTLDRIYRFLGLELDDETRDRMARWMEGNRPGAHGVHRYGPEQFGLSTAQLRHDFAFYTDTHSVPLETS